MGGQLWCRDQNSRAEVRSGREEGPEVRLDRLHFRVWFSRGVFSESPGELVGNVDSWTQSPGLPSSNKRWGQVYLVKSDSVSTPSVGVKALTGVKLVRSRAR